MSVRIFKFKFKDRPVRAFFRNDFIRYLPLSLYIMWNQNFIYTYRIFAKKKLQMFKVVLIFSVVVNLKRGKNTLKEGIFTKIWYKVIFEYTICFLNDITHN